MSNDFQEMLIEMDDRQHLTKVQDEGMLRNYKEGSRVYIQVKSPGFKGSTLLIPHTEMPL